VKTALITCPQGGEGKGKRASDLRPFRFMSGGKEKRPDRAFLTQLLVRKGRRSRSCLYYSQFLAKKKKRERGERKKNLHAERKGKRMLSSHH